MNDVLEWFGELGCSFQRLVTLYILESLSLTWRLLERQFEERDALGPALSECGAPTVHLLGQFSSHLNFNTNKHVKVSTYIQMAL